jgi:hypothetical protein
MPRNPQPHACPIAESEAQFEMAAACFWVCAVHHERSRGELREGRCAYELGESPCTLEMHMSTLIQR